MGFSSAHASCGNLIEVLFSLHEVSNRNFMHEEGVTLTQALPIFSQSQAERIYALFSSNHSQLSYLPGAEHKNWMKAGLGELYNEQEKRAWEFRSELGEKPTEKLFWFTEHLRSKLSEISGKKLRVFQIIVRSDHENMGDISGQTILLKDGQLMVVGGHKHEPGTIAVTHAEIGPGTGYILNGNPTLAKTFETAILTTARHFAHSGVKRLLVIVGYEFVE